MKREKEKYGRLNFILAIVFLMVGAVIARLISLQVVKYDLYMALAAGQHQVNSQIEPSRGRIFIRDAQEDGGKLYPLATNKDFAHVYAVPTKINDPQYASEQLYEIFDKTALEEGIIEALKKDEFFSPLFNPAASGTPPLSEKENEERMGFFEIKRDLEIEEKSKLAIDFYYQRLSKKNDPYEPIKDKVDEEVLSRVMALEIEGISYIMQKHRYYPEKNIGSHLIGFVGHGEENRKGRYGLEGFFNEELTGKYGSMKAEKAAGGSVVIINDREYVKPIDGSDLILTIDRSIQFTACNKLKEGIDRYGADSGSVVILEPGTGAILAMCSWPDYDPNNFEQTKDIQVFNNPAIFDAYEPGSIFKVMTMGAGLDSGVVTPGSTYEDKGAVMIPGWPKLIKNSDYDTMGARGIVTMLDVLEYSLNTGAMHVMQKMGADKFAEYVRNFGFGEKSGIELQTEGITNINSLLAKNIRPIEAATASFGQGISVTPLQITAAFGAVANGGILMKPFLVKEVVSPDGNIYSTQPSQVRRVISEKSALLLSGMAVRVVEDGHANYAGVKGYYIGGKTGTAQVPDRGGYGRKTIHSFVGFGPADNPRFVMLVKLDHPRNVRYAASSAAPLFGEIADFILNYYQVPKER